MKTFYLKHFFKTSVLMLTILLGTSSWGQTETFFSFTGTSGYLATPAAGWNSSGTEGGAYLKLSPGSVTSPEYPAANDVVFTYSIASFGSGTVTDTKLFILNSLDDSVISEYTLNTANSSTYVNGTVNIGNISNDFRVKIEGLGTGANQTSNKGTRLRNFVLVGEIATLCEASNITFTNTTVNKDLLDPSFTQTATSLNATTAVTYESSDELVATVNATTGEVALVGIGTATITATQEAGEHSGVDYCTGTATYDVVVTTSIPLLAVSTNSASLSGFAGGATSTETITVEGFNLTGNIALALSGDTNFSINPTSLSSTGGEVTITYTPSATPATHSATLTVSNGLLSEVITLSGVTNEMPEEYAGIGTFEKITSTDDLTDGYYVITNEADAFAMNNTHTTFFGHTEITPSSGELVNPDVSIVWKIETNGEGRTIYNEVTGKYVGYTGSQNTASAEDAPANTNRWTFTYTDDKFTVNNVATTARQLSYNSSSPRFAAYGNTNQQELQLYKLTAPSTEVTWTTDNTWSNLTGPTFETDVIIEGTLTVGELNNIDAKSLTVNGSLTIADGGTINLKGAITNNANFIVENGGNLIQTADYTGSNNGSMTVKKNSSLIKHLDYTIWSSPVAGQGLQAFSPQTLDYRIYSYATTTDTWVQATGNFEAGRGYMFRAPNDFVTTPYIYNGEFNGVANNGDITVNFTPTGLYQDLGNPYPSNIDVNQFWTANPGTATLYFWTNTNAWDTATQEYVGNNWATYSSIGGTAAVNGDKIPTNIIQTGQGFVVETDQVISSVTFDNTMRTADNTGVFFRSAAPQRHRMWLGFSNENMQLNQILIGYMDGATNNFDLGIDSKMFSYNGSALFSIIENETDQFTIQGRTMPFTSADVVPLGLKAISAGTFTISLTNFDGLFTEDQDIFLNDNLTQTQHNLKDGGYTFVSTEGTFLDRFEVVYTATMSINNPELANAWVIYNQDNNFNIEAQSFELKDVVVYDMLGRVIYQSAAEGNSHVITNLDSNAVMIVKITTTDGQEFSRKVAK